MYDEQSFLNGLVAGLTATAAPQTGEREIRLQGLNLTGIKHIPFWHYNAWIFDYDPYIYLSKVEILSPYSTQIIYEFGERNNPQRETRGVKAGEKQVFFHAYRLPPDNADWRAYIYRLLYLYDSMEARNRTLAVRISGEAFKYTVEMVDWGGIRMQTFDYPGSPERVTTWESLVSINSDLL